MKKIKITALLVTLIVFGSCQFNQSVNSDLSTGAYSRGDGLGVDDVSIEIFGKKENRNEFFYGEKVDLVFNDITGFVKKDDRVYPKMSIHIVKNEKDTVVSVPNTLENISDGTAIAPLQLRAFFNTAFPHKNNEKYKVYVSIQDKNSDGKFSYELPFTIKESGLLKVENNGLSYNTAYLWNETLKQPVVDKNVKQDHTFNIILEGINGLEIEGHKVFPIFSIDIEDAKGNKIASDSNLFSQYETSGVNYVDVEQQISATIAFTEGKINNPCTVTAKLKDKKSDKEIVITSELEVEN